MAVPINEAIKAVLGSGNITSKLSAAEIEKFVDLYLGGAGNILYDEAGNVAFITTKSGLTYNFSTPQGVASEYVAANTLITDATYDVATQEVTTTVGNVIDVGGQVTKKGLAAVASTGAQVLSGVVTALGGVMIGVQWYRDNPEFWTDVSQKLLPFAYDDPTDKSWSDIFYEALFPTAMDSDGNTYVQEKDLEFIKNTLVAGNFFTPSTYVEATIENLGENVKLPFSSLVPPQYTNLTTATDIHPVEKINEKYPFANIGGRWYFDYETDGAKGIAINYLTSELLYGTQEYGTPAYRGTHGILFKEKETYKYVTVYVSGNTNSESTETGIDNLTDFGGSSYSPPTTYPIAFPVIMLPTMYYENGPKRNTDERNKIIEAIKDAIRNNETISGSQYDNTNLAPSAQYPTADKTLQETYPDWYDNAVTTVNPNWNPKEPESDDNPKYIVWLPLQMPDATNNANEGNTQPDVTQNEGQSGKPTPDTNIGEKTDEAINDKVLPDPYPETQPGTDTGNTGTTPNPPVDPTPTPDVPVITGGTANALWRIYNPSESVLQEFGKWLWSDNWVDIVKQLFANNPAEGIIGLHMIYVTPPVGGTSNIIVGYLDSGVASNWVSQQYVTIDCGTVQIPLYYQNALDYGYTKVYCYLPFIGIVPLDSYDIIGKSVNIKYTVDVLTGTVLAQISVTYGGYSAVLYTFNGSCSVEYPLTSGSRASQMLSLITGAVGGAAVGGAGGAVLGAARGAMSGADVRMSGNLAGNAGAMGIRKPYIIVKRPVEYAAAAYNEFYGNPANVTYQLKDFSGYVRVKSVHVSAIANATQDEKSEIENLLKSGVIVQ